MYRDFSAKSKQNLLDLVSQVENEKWSDFTDWVGDRWLDFESWIGSLNIKNYVGNVNAYHKKVIDRQNYTAEAIDDIFAEVTRIDSRFAKFLQRENLMLSKWNDYVEALARTIHPQNTNLNLDFMKKSADSILNDLYNMDAQFKKDGFADFSGIDILERFLMARNEKKDAVLFALGHGLFEGIKSIINNALGQDDMNDTAFKNSIMTIIKGLDPSLLDIGAEKTALNIMKTTNGVCKDYNDFCNLIRKNDESLKKWMMDDDSFEKVGKFIKYGKAGVDAFEVIFSDYCNTIAVLEELRDGLNEINGDPTTIQYCTELINEYKNKFGIIVNQFYELAIDKGIDEFSKIILNAGTGGLFGITASAHELIWKISGVASDGDALGSIYASAFYSDDLIAAYNFYAEKLQSGNYTQDDIIKCKHLFEIAKTAKIEELKNIKRLTHAKYLAEIDEQLILLEQMQWNSIDSW